MEEYTVGCRYFHGRLALVARGFSLDELKTIFMATMLAFLRGGADYERKHAREVFEDVHDWIEDKMVQRIAAYAKRWLAIPGGNLYQKEYIHPKYAYLSLCIIGFS